MSILIREVGNRNGRGNEKKVKGWTAGKMWIEMYKPSYCAITFGESTIKRNIEI
jgi:hypothetical protein